MNGEDGWGHAEGHRVRDELSHVIDAHPATLIFRISLASVRRTDASFPRESVIELACRFRGEKGFCLTDVSDADLLDNWDAAAIKRNQPLLALVNDTSRLLGPVPAEGLAATLAYVDSLLVVTASQAAVHLNLSVPNASNKLKQLWQAGYILRKENIAASGGLEYEYLAIR